MSLGSRYDVGYEKVKRGICPICNNNLEIYIAKRSGKDDKFETYVPWCASCNGVIGFCDNKNYYYVFEVRSRVFSVGKMPIQACSTCGEHDPMPVNGHMLYILGSTASTAHDKIHDLYEKFDRYKAKKNQYYSRTVSSKISSSSIKKQNNSYKSFSGYIWLVLVFIIIYYIFFS